jgi:hypothetical protein
MPALPYLICAGILMATGLLVVQRLCKNVEPAVAGNAQKLR